MGTVLILYQSLPCEQDFFGSNAVPSFCLQSGPARAAPGWLCKPHQVLQSQSDAEAVRRHAGGNCGETLEGLRMCRRYANIEKTLQSSACYKLTFVLPVLRKILISRVVIEMRLTDDSFAVPFLF